MKVKTYQGMVGLGVRSTIVTDLAKHEWLVLEKVHGENAINSLDGENLDALLDAGVYAHVILDEEAEYDRLDRKYGAPDKGDTSFVGLVFNRPADLVKMLKSEQVEEEPAAVAKKTAAAKVKDTGDVAGTDQKGA
jgi:hypothetical protein